MNALSIATGVIAFVEFGVKLLSLYSEIPHNEQGHHSALSALEAESRELSAHATHAREKIASLREHYPQQAECLDHLTAECALAEKELQGLIDGLPTQDSRGARFQRVVRIVSQRGDFERLEDRLKGIRDQTSAIVITCIIGRPSDVQDTLHSVKKGIDNLQPGSHEKLSGTFERDTMKALWASAVAAGEASAHALSWPSISQAEESCTPTNDSIERRILEGLTFSDMTAQEDQIRPPFPGAFQWLLDEGGSEDIEGGECSESDKSDHSGGPSPAQHRTGFKEWLESTTNEPYWITGEPGSGKSTLMKFICTNKQVKEHLRRWAGELELLTCGIYIWNHGSSKRKNQVGFLLTMLYQLLSQRPDLCRLIARNHYTYFQLGGVGASGSPDWTIDQLKDAIARFLYAVRDTHRVAAFIDGLDEYEGDPSELITFLMQLRQDHDVKLCLSSRPLIIFRHNFSEYPSLTMEHLTAPDIKHYVHTRIKESRAFEEIRAVDSHNIGELESQIVYKAKGMFLWVAVVVEKLIITAQDYNNIRAIWEVLDELPSGLSKLLAEQNAANLIRASSDPPLTPSDRVRSLMKYFEAQARNQSAMNTTDDDGGVLYGLACDCEALFDTELANIEEKTSFLANLVAEYQQRFAIWAANLGVFARKSQSLDTRLRNHADTQDIVARLLVILRRSLHQLMQATEAGSGANTPPRVEDDAPRDTALSAIDATLARLNRLGVAIRQSSRDRIDVKVQSFAASIEFGSIAALFQATVQQLYPNAHLSLRQYLAKSMTDRYASMLYKKFRGVNLQSRRTQKSVVLMPTIDEGRQVGLDGNAFGLLGNNAEQQMLSETPGFPPLAGMLPTTPPSNLSTLNSKQLKSVLYKTNDFRVPTDRRGGTSSVQVGRGNYPRLSSQKGGNFITCEWCSKIINRRDMSDNDWRRHIDEDFKPYMCIFDACSDGHPAFPSFAPWLTHMKQHNRRWHQRIFPTSSWICAVCDDSPDIYTSPETLHGHLVQVHGDVFDPSKLQAIARQSKVERQRPWNECPLCCFVVEKEETPPKRRKEQLVNKAGNKSSRTSFAMKHPESEREIDRDSNASDDFLDETGHALTSDSVEMMARHIAAHLQTLMLLTIRLDFLHEDHCQDTQDDANSISVHTGDSDDASFVKSTWKSTADTASVSDVEMPDIDGETPEATDMPLLDPDAVTDFGGVPRKHDELPVEEDGFLRLAATSSLGSSACQKRAKCDIELRSYPSQNVDYLSHDWREEDIWASWSLLLSLRDEFINSERLENALWRVWAKSKNKLATVLPETMNWLKDSDVTWLYGPLQTGTSALRNTSNSPNSVKLSQSSSSISPEETHPAGKKHVRFHVQEVPFHLAARQADSGMGAGPAGEGSSRG